MFFYRHGRPRALDPGIRPGHPPPTFPAPTIVSKRYWSS
jgi:hypothetical protein